MISITLGMRLHRLPRDATEREIITTLKIKRSLSEEILSNLGRINRSAPYSKPNFLSCYVILQPSMEFSETWNRQENWKPMDFMLSIPASHIPTIPLTSFSISNNLEEIKQLFLTLVGCLLMALTLNFLYQSEPAYFRR